MITCAVLATGPSMSQEIADSVRGKCKVVAVSDAYKLAPWADALVSNDYLWWKNHPKAFQFEGKKFCGMMKKELTYLPPKVPFSAGCNSGLQGIRVAMEYLRATKILLCGFDQHGTHFFGLHPAPLKNTTDQRRTVHLRQFIAFSRAKERPEVINCTPGSAITCFSMGDLAEELAKL